MSSHTRSRLYVPTGVVGGIAIAGLIAHYADWMPGNVANALGWIAFIGIFLWLAISEDTERPRVPWLLVIVVALGGVAFHTVGTTNASWRNHGMFDDAAWDVLFGLNRVAPGVPYQAAFYDLVGLVSRETLFHYYTTGWFKLFGYNVEVLHAASLSLTLANCLFIALIVKRVTGLRHVEWPAAFGAITLPFLFCHTYMAHRYAIAMPLASGSFYFLLGAWQTPVRWRAALGGVLAGLTVSGAVMGKHYVACLVLSAAALLLSSEGRSQLRERRWLAPWVGVGTLAGCLPLLAFIAFNSSYYGTRERELMQDFVTNVRTTGWPFIWERLDAIRSMFIDAYQPCRQFLSERTLLPLSFLPFLLLGWCIELRRRHFSLFILSVVPVAGTVLAGVYDFRVLIAVPFWLASIAIGLHWLAKSARPWGALAAIVVAAWAIGADTWYLWQLRKDPIAIFGLNPRAAPVCRLMTDLALGRPEPSPMPKRDEFIETAPADVPECFFAPLNGFGVAHALFSWMPEPRRLAFIDSSPAVFDKVGDLWSINRRTLLTTKPAGRDWLLLWEKHPSSVLVMDELLRLAPGSKTISIEKPVSWGTAAVVGIRIQSASVPDFLARLKGRTTIEVPAATPPKP